MHICVFAVICLISVSFFSQMYFLIAVFFFVSHSVVDMLWENTARHLLRQAFLRQASHPPSPSPIVTPRRGHSVCRQDALDGFCCELSWGILWFMIWLSAASDEWSLTAMLGNDESHKMQRRSPFFSDHSLRHPKLQTSFHLRQPYFVILSTDSSLSLSPTPSLYFQ